MAAARIGRRIGRWFALVLAPLAVAGCPVGFKDDFTTVRADAGRDLAAEGSGGSSLDSGVGGKSGFAGGPSSGGGTAGASVDSGGTTGRPGDGASGASASSGGTAGGGIGGTTLGGGGADAGEAGIVAVDPCSRCATNETCCDGKCADLRIDTHNCRSCGSGCPGTICDNASCTNTCALGFIDCNRNVVDGCEVNAGVDPANCGNCGIACGFQQECVGGACQCPKGTADCDGVKTNGCETDTLSDPTSCGGCGKVCGASELCAAGRCACEPAFDDCDKSPVDGCEASLLAASTCGSCALDCGPHSVCVAAGQCACAPGYLDCDTAVPGCETPATDPAHCGSCTTSCGVGTPACDGTNCSTGCGALSRCGASCVDLQADPQNCGGCAKAVGLNQICVAGKPQCGTGFANCDLNPADCEVNIETDSKHCGACGAPCKSGAVCASGSCGCAPATPNDCGATCQQCCNASQCSDGNPCTTDTCTAGVCAFSASCGVGTTCCAGSGCFACCGDADCPPGKVCSGNQCVNLTCTPPQVLCNLKCVNPTTDAVNCGACGNACGPGRGCATAACTPKWVAFAAAPVSFVSREKAAYTAVGSKAFIWGGVNAGGTNLADGAFYDPGTDTWSLVGATGQPPSARVLATAVWTGSVVVVWGGGDAAASTEYRSGGRYDPITNTWQAMSTQGAPGASRAAYGVWTGSRVLFYGGYDKQGTPNSTVSLYDPSADTWAVGSSLPPPLTYPDVGWTGSLFIAHGGLSTSGTASSSTYTYQPSSNRWTQVASSSASRFGAFGTWDGAFLLAWSGAGMSGQPLDGKLYDPSSDKWTSINVTGAPSRRWAPYRQSGWSARLSPGVTLVAGGSSTSSGAFFTDGGIYSSTTNAWTSVAAWPSGLSHLWGAGVWTGSEFVLWSGRTGTSQGALTAGGERYRP